MQEIEIYTDGGCSGNPGPGGWAYLVRADGDETKGSGGDEGTTNNRMELTAVINALECVKSHAVLRGRPIAVYTDSQYVQKGISSWIENWRRNGWKTAAKKPVKNRDLWEALVALRDTLDIRWHWVKGHAGHEHNERVDGLVQREIAKRS